MSAAAFGYCEPCEISQVARESYLAFGVDLAKQASDTILPYFRPDALEVENKEEAGFDPVTHADRDAEALMRRLIGERYPDHGVLGEEFGYAPGNGPTWVLDPIDGTRAFVMGLVHWGTLVALFDGRKPVIGVLHQPYLNESFAGNGERAYLARNGHEQTLCTRACSGLSEALSASTSPDMFVSSKECEGFARVRGLVRDMRYGTDCYAYAMLAMGQIDLVIEASLKPYDVQALMPIVEGAGGLLTTWQGENAAMGGAVIASGDPRLHEQVLQELQS